MIEFGKYSFKCIGGEYPRRQDCTMEIDYDQVICIEETGSENFIDLIAIGDVEYKVEIIARPEDFKKLKAKLVELGLFREDAL